MGRFWNLFSIPEFDKKVHERIQEQVQQQIEKYYEKLPKTKGMATS